MNELLARLNLRYKGAERGVKDAESAVERASGVRLAALMKLQPQQRLEHIEDDNLTRADRSKLRKSLSASLRHRKRDRFKFGTRSLIRRIRNPRRYIAATVALAAVVLPLGFLIHTAEKNTDEIVVLPQAIDFSWTLPSGTKEQKIMPVGAHLAIALRPGKPAVARRWIEGQGYATAEVNVRER
jgi:hypothetical protein